MTDRDRPTNPLLARPSLVRHLPSHVVVNDREVPTDLDAYCAYLNAREARRGRWLVVKENDVRKVHWEEETGTDDWLRENGLVPKIGRRA